MQRIIFPACKAAIRRGGVVAMGEKSTVLTIGVRGFANAKVVTATDSINPKEVRSLLSVGEVSVSVLIFHVMAAIEMRLNVFFVRFVVHLFYLAMGVVSNR